ncbi:hypothetical protein BC826DRAFT_966031 [Russula brevipes]|nr:hypothetical protein BC826DRAFT_966031 [Russula brevipes]
MVNVTWRPRRATLCHIGTWYTPLAPSRSMQSANTTISPSAIEQSVSTMSSPNRAQKSVPESSRIPADISPHMGERLTHFQEEFDGPRGLCDDRRAHRQCTPRDILFLYGQRHPPELLNVEWHTLVHVCRRWRNIVFASPRRLNLRLLCRRGRPVRAMLDIWPALPIVIVDSWIRTSGGGLDNIIAALEHPDRSAGEALAAKMQVPFPELTHLVLVSEFSEYVSMPALPLPDSFLGGSAPRLQSLKLCDISFPALPNLLLSASDLVYLSLKPLPHSGYISPEAMVACLSSLSRLKSLSLAFRSRRSRPDQHIPPPQTRIVLPALTDLFFGGTIEYSEDFLARIDTPVLNRLSTLFLSNLAFGVPHLKQFIGRAKGLKPYKVAQVAFKTRWIQLSLTEPLPLSLEMTCNEIDLKVHAMSLVCSQLSPFLSLVEHLDLTADYWPSKPQEEDDIVPSRFLELFQSFTSVQSLYVSEGLIPFITLALQQLIGERVPEVLPNLRDLFMGGSEKPRAVQEAMQPFLTARRLSGQPVVVYYPEGWMDEYER